MQGQNSIPETTRNTQNELFQRCDCRRCLHWKVQVLRPGEYRFALRDEFEEQVRPLRTLRLRTETVRADIFARDQDYGTVEKE
jgi:hypothetical protein